MSRTMRTAGTTVGFPTTVVPSNDHEAALEFSAVIIPFSTGELAQAGKRTKDAAKKWKEGRSMPSALSLLNMAREIPAVRAWTIAKLGANQPPEFMNSPAVLTAMMAALHQVSKQDGPDGDAVRALMRGGK